MGPGRHATARKRSARNRLVKAHEKDPQRFKRTIDAPRPHIVGQRNNFAVVLVGCLEPNLAAFVKFGQHEGIGQAPAVWAGNGHDKFLGGSRRGLVEAVLHEFGFFLFVAHPIKFPGLEVARVGGKQGEAKALAHNLLGYGVFGKNPHASAALHYCFKRFCIYVNCRLLVAVFGGILKNIDAAAFFSHWNLYYWNKLRSTLVSCSAKNPVR